MLPVIRFEICPSIPLAQILTLSDLYYPMSVIRYLISVTCYRQAAPLRPTFQRFSTTVSCSAFVTTW